MSQALKSIDKQEYLYVNVVHQSPNFMITVIISFVHFSIHHTDLQMKVQNFIVIHKQRSLALKVQFKHDLKRIRKMLSYNEEQYETNKSIFWLVAGSLSGIISRRWWRMFSCFALPPQGIVNHSEILVTLPAAFPAATRGGRLQVCIITN